MCIFDTLFMLRNRISREIHDQGSYESGEGCWRDFMFMKISLNVWWFSMLKGLNSCRDKVDLCFRPRKTVKTLIWLSSSSTLNLSLCSSALC